MTKSRTPPVETRVLKSQVWAPGDSSGARTICGYAAEFGRSNSRSEFSERMRGSFFSKSRSDGWPSVVAKYGDSVLGTTAGKTLRLKTEPQGLMYEVDLTEAQSELYELVRRRDVVHSEVAFQTYEEEWGAERICDEDRPVRQLLSGRLISVSPVIAPAVRTDEPDRTAAWNSLAEFMALPVDEVVLLASRGELAPRLRRHYVYEGARS